MENNQKYNCGICGKECITENINKYARRCFECNSDSSIIYIVAKQDSDKTEQIIFKELKKIVKKYLIVNSKHNLKKPDINKLIKKISNDKINDIMKDIDSYTRKIISENEENS